MRSSSVRVYSLINNSNNRNKTAATCDGVDKHLSHIVGKPTMSFPTRSDTNRPVQSQKSARSLKFGIGVEEELYYLSSENKGADQLRSYCEADLHLCFRSGRLLVFPCGGSFGVKLLCSMDSAWRKPDFCQCENKGTDQL